MYLKKDHYFGFRQITPRFDVGIEVGAVAVLAKDIDVSVRSKS